MTAHHPLFYPIGHWTGRLILPHPRARRQDGGVWIEIQNAPQDYRALIGQTVPLVWSSTPEVQHWVQAVTQDVAFTHWTYLSQKQGNLHPDRLNGWRQVSPLESLAGARRDDDVVVVLEEATVGPDREGVRSLVICTEPVQITGRSMALVTVLQPVPEARDRYWVRHYNPDSRLFDGPQAVMQIPGVPPDRQGVCRFTPVGLERSPFNAQGWYVYGDHDKTGTFVVGAIEPRALMQVKPDQFHLGPKAAIAYLQQGNWHETPNRKGTGQTALVTLDETLQAATSFWQLGDTAIVVHLYGGIGGRNGEKTPFGLVPGHFSYGFAQVIRDPITADLRFDIHYKQVYGHNPDGIISGSIKWFSYAGDLHRGWLGDRPISDLLIKLEVITRLYDFDGLVIHPLAQFSRQLDAIAARYRIGHGTGVALINLATSCVQDSNQALYLTIKKLQTVVRAAPEIRAWLQKHPQHPQGRAFRRLATLGRVLERSLVPLGIARPDWHRNALHWFKTRNFHNLLDMVLRALLTWRTMMPRPAYDTIARTFLKQGAMLWFIRTNQVGGDLPDIYPLAPTPLLGHRNPPRRSPPLTPD